MAGVEDEVEELFYDSSDCLRTPCGSPATSEKGSAGRRSSEELRSFEHAFWHRELKSVSERRSRFLQGMGFDDLMFPLGGGGHGVEESPSGRVAMESDAAGSVSSQAPVQAEDRGSHAAQVSGSGGSQGMFKDVGSMRSFTERNTATGSEEKPKSSDVARDRKSGSWWRSLIKRRHGLEFCKNDVSTKHSISPRTTRTQVQRHRKRCMEFSALHKGQEIKAHKGLIRVLKFNTSGWYLATGGEDCVVRIWRVIEEEAPLKLSKVFKIVETPLHEFRGHTSDILDLSWASSDCILSSSKDKTVRMWRVGSEECQRVFRHNDYVTCIQFNPVDEKYFISGSIDGKVRIWGVTENRVLDWYDQREIVTAVCYKPDGTGFVVGSIRGKCRTFDCSGSINLKTQLQIQGRKKSSGKCITGLQFSPVDPQRIMINSADSSIRIASGIDVVHKFRGLRKSKSQRSASFTWDGRYAVSVDEDSRIYIWNAGEAPCGGSGKTTVVRSCEHFSSDGATAAVQWPRSGRDAAASSVPTATPTETMPGRSNNNKDHRFSLGGWLFFPDGSSRGSAATWPEEKLLSSSPPLQPPCDEPLSPPWRSLVIVSANEDGTIRSYHKYGLPVRP